ncbi:ABC transporter ATP-binding protein [Streptomyces formicae]|uniref:Methionine ABC transporter ATP-binding protein n=1 Tax=Streptomyces formicae TaxID=1616117 RepID=A0A291Q218_9ACTN|nr:ABC transporter ATP-binding protein [Streptomyces formicae]ATL25545.1 Methionine ABC transporter ATP-binding protein [Streptomyces formicae]
MTQRPRTKRSQLRARSAASESRPEPPPGHLPVAGPRQVRRAAARLIRQDTRAFTAMLVFNALAAAAGLVGPWLLGRIINTVKDGGSVATVDRLALGILAGAVAQLLLSRHARYLGHRFGERTLARIREQFVDRALALPASVVERAGAGDLTARGTTDVATAGQTLRDTGPDVFVAAVQALFILGAVFLLDPLLGACGVLGLVGIWFATRWYLRRAHTAYLEEGAAHSTLAEVLAATASGARTVEAFGLREQRVADSEAQIGRCVAARERTLHLRSVLFPSIDISYAVPVVAVLLIGGVLHDHGSVSLGTVVACALYLRQLSQPLDTILQQVEHLQSSTASFARVEGLAGTATVDLVEDGGQVESVGVPADDQIDVDGVCFSYGGGPEVLRDVDLSVRPGERLAIVGPSGAGKTTLSRLLAGIDAPVKGSVTVGRVPIADLPPDRLRRQVVLVTQEHHVFLGTVRDNLRIAAESATDSELQAALSSVGADWAEGLADGLDTELGPGGRLLHGAEAQQLALARVVLADPHTVILDEATALLDPTTARHTERALAAVLHGRTVIAIAHRLQTAHDADRVAVMEDGRVTELGSHDALVAADGAYAALWHSWHSQPEERPALG